MSIINRFFTWLSEPPPSQYPNLGNSVDPHREQMERAITEPPEPILAPASGPHGVPIDIPNWAKAYVPPRQQYQTVKVDDPELRVEAVYRRMDQLKANHKRAMAAMESRIQHAERMQKDTWERESNIGQAIAEAGKEAHTDGRNQQRAACMAELYRVLHIGADGLDYTDILDPMFDCNVRPRKPSKALVRDLEKLLARWQDLKP